VVFVGHGLHLFGFIPRPMAQLAIFGVLVFFVHTCLVLMFSLERLCSQPRMIAVRFYIRRILRIYPLAIACVGFCVLLRIPRTPWQPMVAHGHLLSNFLLSENIVGGDNTSVSGPLWSLPYEVQMYLLLPFLFFAARKWGIPGAWLLWLSGLFIAIAPSGQVAHLLHVGVSYPILFSAVRFFPCFLAGVLAYALFKSVTPFLSHRLWPMWIIMLAIAYSFAPPSRLMDWLTCLALGLTIPRFKETPANWLSASSNTVAKYSYGIYLSHLPIMTMIFMTGWALGFKIAACIALFAVVPVALYHCLEAPCIHYSIRKTSVVSDMTQGANLTIEAAIRVHGS
jgi:peptidoglycan/LPS O-acetylase OafA/YrhL